MRGVRRRKSAPHLEHILTMLEREGTAKHEREGIKFTCVLCYLSTYVGAASSSMHGVLFRHDELSQLDGRQRCIELGLHC